ncbi:MAG: hypothetical protein P8Y67_03795 [Alphaproteobacteria bacterium]
MNASIPTQGDEPVYKWTMRKKIHSFTLAPWEAEGMGVFARLSGEAGRFHIEYRKE